MLNVDKFLEFLPRLGALVQIIAGDLLLVINV